VRRHGCDSRHDPLTSQPLQCLRWIGLITTSQSQVSTRPSKDHTVRGDPPPKDHKWTTHGVRGAGSRTRLTATHWAADRETFPTALAHSQAVDNRPAHPSRPLDKGKGRAQPDADPVNQPSTSLPVASTPRESDVFPPAFQYPSDDRHRDRHLTLSSAIPRPPHLSGRLSNVSTPPTMILPGWFLRAPRSGSTLHDDDRRRTAEPALPPPRIRPKFDRFLAHEHKDVGDGLSLPSSSPSRSLGLKRAAPPSSASLESALPSKRAKVDLSDAGSSRVRRRRESSAYCCQ
jgi:hypothetical protein